MPRTLSRFVNPATLAGGLAVVLAIACAYTVGAHGPAAVYVGFAVGSLGAMCSCDALAHVARSRRGGA